MPGCSWSATHGWLNQPAVTGTEPSETRAVTRTRRPRSGRFATFRTSPTITASSSGRRSRIATSSTADS